MKKSILRFILLVALTLFTACSAGYVSEEPTYQENRPPRPTERHVWVEGNWIWSRQTRTYHHGAGNWEVPIRNRSYELGYWKRTNHGSQWKKGKWH